MDHGLVVSLGEMVGFDVDFDFDFLCVIVKTCIILQKIMLKLVIILTRYY